MQKIKIPLVLLILLALPILLFSADETAKRDGNRVPALLGVSEDTTETRRLKTTNDGFLITVSTSAPGSSGAATETTLSSIDGKTPSLGQATSANSVPVVVSSDQSSISVTGSSVTVVNAVGAAAVPIQDGGNTITVDGTVVQDLSGHDTPKLSTFSIAGVAVQVLVSDLIREAHLITNEGPDDIRCGPVGEVTATVGQRIITDQAYTKDGPIKPYRGALACISTTGNPSKVSVDEGT